MPQPIAMPQMGVTMEAGSIVRWLKQVGDVVKKDEPIMEIMTDKVSLEMTSDVEGTLLAIVVEPGKEVPVGTVLAYVGQPGEAVPGAAAAAPAAAAPAAPSGAAPAPASAPAQAAAPAPADGGKVRATPAARSRAQAHGLDLNQLQGTGPSGRIQARDVEAARQAPPSAPAATQPAAVAPAPAPAPGATYRDIPVTGVRKVIADRMAQSFHNAVPVLLTTEACMSGVDDLLARLGDQLSRRTGGKVGYLPVVMKAVAVALRAHPAVNAHWLGQSIRQFDQINLGVAVSLNEGLMVPVLRDSDRKGLAELATEVGALAGKARQGGLTMAELEGGTFTISNLGGYSIEFFMPVINPPQVAILGLGRTVQKPVVQDGQVVVKPMLPLSLVFDHRALDGAPAAAFLHTLKEVLEEPYRLLI